MILERDRLGVPDGPEQRSNVAGAVAVLFARIAADAGLRPDQAAYRVAVQTIDATDEAMTTESALRVLDDLDRRIIAARSVRLS